MPPWIFYILDKMRRLPVASQKTVLPFKWQSDLRGRKITAKNATAKYL